MAEQADVAGARGAQAVGRAIAVVRCLAAEGDDLGVSEVATRTGLTVSTAHRLLQALRAEGIVEQDSRSHRYYLGSTLVALGRRAEAVLDGPRARRGSAGLAPSR